MSRYELPLPMICVSQRVWHIGFATVAKPRS